MESASLNTMDCYRPFIGHHVGHHTIISMTFTHVNMKEKINDTRVFRDNKLLGFKFLKFGFCLTTVAVAKEHFEPHPRPLMPPTRR